MIDRISAQIAHKLLTAQAFDEKDLPLYQYSLHVLLGTLLNYSAFIIVGLIFGMFWENVAMIFSFSIIRKFVGGYHAEKYRNCFFGSIIIDGACLWVIRSISGIGMYLFVGITMIAFALICVLSPVEHKNKRLNSKEKKVFKLIAIILSGFSLLISILLSIAGSYISIGIAIGTGICLSAVLMVTGRIIQIRHERISSTVE